MFSRFTLIATLLASTSAFAGPVWTDWVSAASNSAAGTLATTNGTVNVSYTGSYAFVQTGCGTAYWDAGNYNGTLDKPLSCDIVALAAGGTKTITFDSAVIDPYIALMSWNTNVVRFSAPFEVISNGSGYWGSGTPVVDADDQGFVGNGEVHAIIRFTGTFTSISFTDSTENWHGFTVGADNKATPPQVPEPSTLALLLGGALAAAALRRRPLARA